MICIEFPICPSAFVYMSFPKKMARVPSRGDAVSYLSYALCQYLRLISRSSQFPSTYYIFGVLKMKQLSNEILILDFRSSNTF